MKTLKFVTNSFYHIYNRGVDSRDIFREDQDYVRFIHSLYEFNDKQFALPHRVSKEKVISRNMHRKPLVNILCFCLMPNHFHLILNQIVDGGITKFMRKLGTGYTMYFNVKYERTGVLFQGKFKAIMVDSDEYFLHLSRYIHLNPIELIEPNWKEEGVRDWSATKDFLRRYRWSSFMDYIGRKNFPSVIQRDLLLKYFRDSTSYNEFIEKFIINDISRLTEITIES